MRYLVYDFSNNTKYIADNTTDGKSDVEISAIESAKELNSIITMGCIIVEPIENDEKLLENVLA